MSITMTYFHLSAYEFEAVVDLKLCAHAYVG